MKNTYITLTFFAILLLLFLFLFFVDIPSPGKTIEEAYILEIK
jgi:hypothetical protein